VPRLERRLGEKTTYSGLNYALLELVLVGLLGREFEVLAREHLFEPLGMTCTFAREARTKPGVAVEHDHVGARLGHQIPVAVAASGLVANATEVVNLLREGVEAAWGDANRVMSPESARLLFTLQPTKHPISKFAIGFHRIRDTEPPVFDHHGHRPGLRCEVNVIPEARVTVVAMCNGERGEAVNQPFLSMVRGICSKQGSTAQGVGR
jgi:CubicO group peptidase (beta-lactamase class C family)